MVDSKRGRGLACTFRYGGGGGGAKVKGQRSGIFIDRNKRWAMGGDVTL